MNNLTHIDLFSGVGGFALAARWAGIETIQFVEIDKFCQKVLQKNFPGVPIHDDIKEFYWSSTDSNGNGLQEQRAEQQAGGDRQFFQNIQPGDLKNEDIKSFSIKPSINPFLLTAGCPCQPASCAGKRRGKEDDRWLWDEAFRVLEESHPTWAIFENVAGLLSLEGGVVFDNLLAQLEGKGYEVWPVIIPACAVGAPHRRDRIWIVARYVADSKFMRQQHPECEHRSRSKKGLSQGCDCHAPDTSHQGLQRGEETGNTRINGEESRNELIGICLGWEEPWIEVATRLCRVDDGVSRGVDRVNRLKALGNAIVPQVAYQIMKSIIAVEEGCVD